MMTDRFDAQLRSHLVESANEHPADGQLASIIDHVAATPQRPTLVARLTWLPGRVGPVPSLVLRYGLVAVALALAALAGALLAGGAGGSRSPSTPFEGTWTSIDPGDGSGQTLVIGPGSTPEVYFEDGYASGAACVDDPIKRFAARGTGTISGDVIEATFPDGGGCGLRTVEVSLLLTHDRSTDTLLDADGVTWRRPLAAAPSAVAPDPTPEPTTDVRPEPTVEPTPEPTVEPAIDPTPEPTIEAPPEPTAEALPESTVEALPEPTPATTAAA